MIHVYVIAPDKSSGIAFCNELKSKSINAEFNYHHIRPRVYNNKISTSNDVASDLNKIFKSFDDKTKSVVIACNTLQLWLPKVDKEYKKNVKVYTTFEACEWKFKIKKKKPLWLGTTPLATKTLNFPTLISLGRPEIQDLVQELIWRIKMREGDEYGTAPEIVKRDASNIQMQKLKINRIKSEIIEALRELNINDVITGCTELPLIFEGKVNGINFIDPADVLAEYIKSQSVVIVFAGGTISSVVNKDGTRIDGKVFDLLEKLAENSPGSYKHLNVSKSEIVYSGFSENMTLKEHKDILNLVIKILDTGISRIVITHGTDSMEQTALFLHNNLEKRLKRDNVVLALTGSNEHAESKKTDAWVNLRHAISMDTKSHKGGVYIAFGNKMVSAVGVTKEFYNGKHMAYTSIKSKDHIKNVSDFNSRVLKFNDKLTKKIGNIKNVHSSVLMYEVNIIRKDHNKFLKLLDDKKPRVVLFKLYHSGTANTSDPGASVSKLVSELTKMGVVCFGATENGEPTDLHLYKTSFELLKSGMIPLYDMLLPVALHKLNLLEVSNLSRKEIIEKMLTSYVGEIDQKLIRWDDIKRLQQMGSM